MSDRDQIATMLHGLPEEFESFIDSINLRLSSTTLDELHGLLLTKELSMARCQKTISSTVTELFQAFNVQCLAAFTSFPTSIASLCSSKFATAAILSLQL